MLIHDEKVSLKVKPQKRGSGIVNSLINKLPFELHIPAGLNKKYSYCGPGTKLQKRLERGDPGINKLDEACKEHDIAYDQNNDLKSRHLADKLLAKKAQERLRSSDASFGEKAAALGVKAIMKAKTKMGLGMKQRRKNRDSRKKSVKQRKSGGVGGGLSLNSAATIARRALKKAPTNSDLNTAIKIAVNAINKSGKKRRKKIPNYTRVLPVPKSGGFLPLIPLFAGLSAIGALTGGAASIAKAVNSAKAAAESLKEAQRHNQTMESIAMGKGLYLKPYKSGLGLFLGPPVANETCQ